MFPSLPNRQFIQLEMVLVDEPADLNGFVFGMFTQQPADGLVDEKLSRVGEPQYGLKHVRQVDLVPHIKLEHQGGVL